MPTDEPMEHVILSYGDLKRLPDGADVYDDSHQRWTKHGPWWHPESDHYRLLGTELKRQSAYLYVLHKYRPYISIR